MTEVTRNAATPAAFGVPETESQRGTKTPATAAVDLVMEFPRKRKELVHALSAADKEAFDRYVAVATVDQGVRLSRHWFIVQAQKPTAVEPSHS